MRITLHGDSLPTAQTYATQGQGDAPWQIAEEVPVAFVFNRRNYSVMMATPDDLADFALGFALTETVIRDLSDISSLDIHQTHQGIDLRFRLVPDALERLDLFQRRRNLVGRASCGLCGLENADVLFRRLEKVSENAVRLDPLIVTDAFRRLRDHQPLNRTTRTVHAAGWATLSGNIALVREDVGRHNALDKLLGAMARQSINTEDGFIVMSSRCSYEIVEKAAMRGVKALATLSAPTAFALRKAREANLTIYTRSGDSVVRITSS